MTLSYRQKILRNPLNTIRTNNRFGKVAGYVINIWKSVVYLDTSEEHSKNEMRKIITFITTFKRIKKKLRYKFNKRNVRLVHRKLHCGKKWRLSKWMRRHLALRKTYYFKTAIVPKWIYASHATPIKQLPFLQKLKADLKVQMEMLRDPK